MSEDSGVHHKDLWDKIANHYDKNFSEEYSAFLPSILNEISTKDKVLELASGTGLVSFEIAKKAYYVHGVELSKSMIDVANKKKNELKIENIRFLQANIFSIPQDKLYNKYDKIVLCNMIHVIPNPEKLLEICKDYLHLDGEIILFSYCHAEKMNFRKKIFSLGMRFLHRIGKIPYMNVFNFNQIREMIKKAGYVIRFESCNSYDFPQILAVIKLIN